MQLRKPTRKLLVLMILLISSLQSWPAFAAVQTLNTNSSKQDSERYTPLDFVSGENTGLDLYLNAKSLNLDLSRTQNIRVRVRSKDLYKSIDRISSFKISMYEIINGERKFVTSQNITLNKGSVKSRIISIGAGYFAAPTKNVEFDVFDTENNLVNTYSAQLNAFNLDSQVQGGKGVNLAAADCDATAFDDCQLDYLFQRITFEAKPQRQFSTRVVKSEEGVYKVTLPVPRTDFKFLGRRIRGRDSNNTAGNGTITATGFGDTAVATEFQVGASATDHGKITYDPINNQIEFSSTDLTTTMVIGNDGKVGIGVDPALGFLNVRNGDGTTPSIVINQGPLANPKLNGALEYSGGSLYFTSGSTRYDLLNNAAGLPSNVVITTGTQTVEDKILDDVTLTGTILIPTHFQAARVLTASNNGKAEWQTITKLPDVTLERPRINGTALFTNTSTAKFNGGILIPGSAGVGRVLMSDLSGNATWRPGSQVNAGLVDNLDSLQFLRSDTNDNVTNGAVISFNSGTRLDVNGDLSIADTNISLDGGSTTFNGTGAISLSPASGANLNLNLNNGDLRVNGDSLVVKSSSGFVGLGTTAPSKPLQINASGFSSYKNADILLTSKSADNWIAGVDNGDSAKFKISNGSSLANDTKLTILKNGRMGIGTTNPTFKLETAGSLGPSTDASYNLGSNTSRWNNIYANNFNGSSANLSGALNVANLAASTNITSPAATITTAVINTLNGNIIDADFDNGSIVFANQDGIFSQDNANLYWDKTNKRLAVGRPNAIEKLTVNGVVALLETTTPGAATGFGKLYVNSADAKLYFTDSSGTDFDLTEASGGDADTFDGLDSSAFLRSNSSTTYSSGTFTANQLTTLDLNSINLSIADNSINFDTMTNTTFNGSGAFTLKPASGSDISLNLRSGADFIVNGDSLVVETGTGFTGLGTTAPSSPLHINATGLNTNNAEILLSANGIKDWTFGVDNGDGAKFKIANGSDLNSDTKITILKDGNVGFGAINPSQKLEINGGVLARALTIHNGTAFFKNNSTVKFNGTVLIPTNPGAGKVLTSDASGNATWQTVAGTGDLLSTSNLSDVADASVARTNLGLAIGTNVQAFSSNLTLLSTKIIPSGTLVDTNTIQTLTNKTITSGNLVTPNLNGSVSFANASTWLQDPRLNGTALFRNNGVAKFNGSILIPGSAGAGKVLTSDGSGNATWQTVTGTGDLLSTNNLSDVASASTARTNLGLAIGTNVQAFDATLQSISSLGTAADKMIYTTGVDTWAESNITVNGRALIDDLTPNAMRSTLGLVIGTDVQPFSNNLSLLTAKIIPSGTLVDTNTSQTLTNKTVTGGNLVTPSLNGSVSFANANTWLQDPQLNGRALFRDNSLAQFNGSILIKSNAGANKILTSDASGNATWQTLAGGPGGLVAANNLSDVASASTARTNLGLAIGTNVQAFSSNLSLLAAKAIPSGTLVDTNTSQTLTNKTITSGNLVTPSLNGTVSFANASTWLQNPQLNGTALFRTNSTAKFNGSILIQASAGANKILTSDASGNATWQTLAGGAGGLVAANNLSDVANAGTSRTNLGLAIGTNVQAFDATLQSVSSLGTAADKIIYTTGVDTWAESPITVNGRALIDDTTPTAMRSTLGLVIGTDVQAFSNNLSLLTTKIIPSGTLVDTNTSQILTNKTITSANLVTPSLNGTVSFANTSTWLQNPQLNGTALFRTNSTAKFNGSILIQASAGANKILTSDASGNATWQTLAGGPGGLVAANNLSDVASASTSRTNLGLAIGTNVQAWDTDLDTLSGKTIPSGSTLADTSSAQTLTNKTLTSPVVNSATINTANLVTPSLNGVVAFANASTWLQSPKINGTALFRDNSLAQFNGSVLIKANAGSGKVLTSDASGNASWQPLAGGGDMMRANNLSDVLSVSTARSNLGLAIGTDVQAWDADLDTWATKTVPSGTVVGTTDTQTLTNKIFQADDGSNGAPSIAFDADTNTGLYRIAADTLGITTAGLERLRVSATGKVGIVGSAGNFTPGALLEVGNGSLTNIDGVDDLLVAGDLEVDNTIYANVISATTIDSNYSTGSMVFSNASGNLTEDNSNLFWDDGANKLGIGNNSPSQTLTVTGNVGISSNLIINTNDLVVDTTTGFTGFGTATPSKPIHVNALGLASYKNADILFTSKSADSWIAGVDNGDSAKFKISNGSSLANDTKVTILKNGNIGIGTNSIDAKLEINGALQFASALKPAGLAGSIGELLQSTGSSSAPTWVSPSSLSVSNASLLDNLDSSQFLRSDTSDNFTSGTLTFDSATSLVAASGSTVDINSSAVSIEDTNISLDGATTTFTQTNGGFIQMIPASGTTFTVNGALAMVPSDLALISAGSSIPVANSIMKITGNGAPVNLTFNPQIADGRHGQIIILKGSDNTNTVTLEEGNGLALTDGLPFVLGNKDTMSLMYDAGDDQWIEISRSDK